MNKLSDRINNLLEGKDKSALDTQIGGNHYTKLKIQPAEYSHANSLGYLQGAVVKYVTRFRDKDGKKDLEKAKHCIELLIELEYGVNVTYMGPQEHFIAPTIKLSDGLDGYREEQRLKDLKVVVGSCIKCNGAGYTGEKLIPEGGRTPEQ
jgi:hypothetical protein